jgi:hypothetical protein
MNISNVNMRQKEPFQPRRPDIEGKGITDTDGLAYAWTPITEDTVEVFIDDSVVAKRVLKKVV